MTDRTFVSPEIVSTHFHLRSGDKVADLGAGSGNFIPVLSRVVGGQGRVYACEIQKNLVEALSDRVRREHLSNVEVIWSDLEEVGGSKIEDSTLDAAIIVNTLFQADNRSAMVAEAARALRSGGKLFVIDWTESWGGLGPQPGHVLSEQDAKAIVETEGLTFERDFDAGSHHYGLAFRK